MSVIPDDLLPVMNALVDAPLAWRTPLEVASALGLGEEETMDILCDLDLAGLLDVWDQAEGPVVTLSALAAERMGARLVEVGMGETPKWARVGEPDPAALRSKHVCISEKAATLAFVADPSPTPDVAVERGERRADRARVLHANPTLWKKTDELPRPTMLVGVGLTPWPGPCKTPGGVCPACGDRSLQPHMYCLYCDRWGLDRLLYSGGSANGVETGRGRTIPPAPDRSGFERSQAEELKARRKTKRLACQQNKLDAERRKKEKPAPVILKPSSPAHYAMRPAPAFDFMTPTRAASLVPAPTR